MQQILPFPLKDLMEKNCGLYILPTLYAKLPDCKTRHNCTHKPTDDVEWGEETASLTNEFDNIQISLDLVNHRFFSLSESGRLKKLTSFPGCRLQIGQSDS